MTTRHCADKIHVMNTKTNMPVETRIVIPKGYRQLRNGEVIRNTDLLPFISGWGLTNCEGQKCENYRSFIHIRAITPPKKRKNKPDFSYVQAGSYIPRECPEGYRFLKKDEVIEKDDLYFSFRGHLTPTNNVGNQVGDGQSKLVYVRKI